MTRGACRKAVGAAPSHEGGSVRPTPLRQNLRTSCHFWGTSGVLRLLGYCNFPRWPGRKKWPGSGKAFDYMVISLVLSSRDTAPDNMAAQPGTEQGETEPRTEADAPAPGQTIRHHTPGRRYCTAWATWLACSVSAPSRSAMVRATRRARCSARPDPANRRIACNNSAWADGSMGQ